MSSHQKFITLPNFKAGIKYWKNETYWPRDFHKRFYDELAEINREDQFSIKWWYRILPHLNCWRITPKPWEMSVKEFTRRANKNRLERLKRAYQKINQVSGADDIENDELTWEIVEEFTEVAADIKEVTSPIFRSKLCHFTSPKRFPVTDSHAMGLPIKDYKKYWNCVRKAWKEETTSKEKEGFRKLLKRAAGDALPDDFPYACKIPPNQLPSWREPSSQMKEFFPF